MILTAGGSAGQSLKHMMVCVNQSWQYNMPAQVQYLVSELRTNFKHVDAMMRRPGVWLCMLGKEGCFRTADRGERFGGPGSLPRTRSRSIRSLRFSGRQRQVSQDQVLR